MSNELVEMTIAEAGPLLKSRAISPVELTQAALDRIAHVNPKVNAFITLTEELARAGALAAEAEIQRGEYKGPLHGIPIALKDLFYTRGIRTTAGSKIMADFVPEFDCAVAESLRNAGAVMVGKTALHEFAYGITNNNPHYGPTRNPWNTDCTSGGSSGGSGVAVATGMAMAAMGTDTGGSIRIPASFCGVAGLKPTFGRVSVYGVFPLGHTLDHVGPLARTAEDLALVYDAIAGYDLRDEFSVDQPVREVRFKRAICNLRIGVPEDYFFDRLQPEVERAVRAAADVLADVGANVQGVKIPGMAELTEASRVSLAAEAAVLHRKDLEELADNLGADVRALLEKGALVTPAEYIDAQLARLKFQRQLEKLFRRVDVIITPTTPLTSFPFTTSTVELGGEQEDARPAATRFTRCFNASGHPAVSVCCGFDDRGMPIGLQIVGRLWDEATVLQVAYAFERATEWHKRRPAL